MLNLEAQRKGRDKTTTINRTYINSGEYRRKYDCITNNVELGRLMYKEVKKKTINKRTCAL